MCSVNGTCQTWSLTHRFFGKLLSVEVAKIMRSVPFFPQARTQFLWRVNVLLQYSHSSMVKFPFWNNIYSQWNFVARAPDWLHIESVQIIFTMIFMVKSQYSWIGHFRVTLGPFESESWCSPFAWKLGFIHMQMKTSFHMKRWAPGLALKKRPKVIIRKWPILPRSTLENSLGPSKP